MSIILQALNKAQKEKETTMNENETLSSQSPQSSPVYFPKEKITLERKQKKYKLFFAIIAVIIFLQVVTYLTIKYISQSNSPIKETPTAQVKGKAPLFNFSKAFKSDPNKTESKTESRPALKMTGIIWDELNPIVLVNDKMLYNGETVSGATIIKITPDRVTFSYNGEEFDLGIQ